MRRRAIVDREGCAVRCGAHYEVVAPDDHATIGRVFCSALPIGSGGLSRGVNIGEVVRVVKMRISGVGIVLVHRAKRRQSRAMFPHHLRRVKGPVR